MEDVQDLNSRNLDLREKIKNNLNSAEKRMGFLNHNGKDYYSALPLINVKYFKTLTDEDREVWREFTTKAGVKAQKIAEEIARLQEEQRKTLEKLILESQENLMEIPGVANKIALKGNATAPI